MSQRKALIASLVITLVLALSAIGIRAAMVDTPVSAINSEGALTLFEPGGGEFDDDDRYEDSDDDNTFEEFDDDDRYDDRDDSEGDEDEEDDDDD